MIWNLRIWFFKKTLLKFCYFGQLKILPFTNIRHCTSLNESCTFTFYWSRPLMPVRISRYWIFLLSWFYVTTILVILHNIKFWFYSYYTLFPFWLQVRYWSTTDSLNSIFYIHAFTYIKTQSNITIYCMWNLWFIKQINIFSGFWTIWKINTHLGVVRINRSFSFACF